MAKLINIGFGNVVNSRKIVAVGQSGCRTGKADDPEHQGHTCADRCDTGAQDEGGDRHIRRLPCPVSTPAGDNRQDDLQRHMITRRGKKSMSKGVLTVVSGFSGAGKGTVMKRLLAEV